MTPPAATPGAGGPATASLGRAVHDRMFRHHERVRRSLARTSSVALASGRFSMQVARPLSARRRFTEATASTSPALPVGLPTPVLLAWWLAVGASGAEPPAAGSLPRASARAMRTRAGEATAPGSQSVRLRRSEGAVHLPDEVRAVGPMLTARERQQQSPRPTPPPSRDVDGPRAAAPPPPTERPATPPERPTPPAVRIGRSAPAAGARAAAGRQAAQRLATDLAADRRLTLPDRGPVARGTVSVLQPGRAVGVSRTPAVASTRRDPASAPRADVAAGGSARTGAAVVHPGRRPSTLRRASRRKPSVPAAGRRGAARMVAPGEPAPPAFAAGRRGDGSAAEEGQRSSARPSSALVAVATTPAPAAPPDAGHHPLEAAAPPTAAQLGAPGASAHAPAPQLVAEGPGRAAPGAPVGRGPAVVGEASEGAVADEAMVSFAGRVTGGRPGGARAALLRAVAAVGSPAVLRRALDDISAPSGSGGAGLPVSPPPLAASHRTAGSLAQPVVGTAGGQRLGGEAVSADRPGGLRSALLRAVTAAGPGRSPRRPLDRRSNADRASQPSAAPLAAGRAAWLGSTAPPVGAGMRLGTATVAAEPVAAEPVPAATAAERIARTVGAAVARRATAARHDDAPTTAQVGGEPAPRSAGAGLPLGRSTVARSTVARNTVMSATVMSTVQGDAAGGASLPTAARPSAGDHARPWPGHAFERRPGDGALRRLTPTLAVRPAIGSRHRRTDTGPDVAPVAARHGAAPAASRGHAGAVEAPAAGATAGRAAAASATAGGTPVAPGALAAQRSHRNVTVGRGGTTAAQRFTDVLATRKADPVQALPAHFGVLARTLVGRPPVTLSTGPTSRAALAAAGKRAATVGRVIHLERAPDASSASAEIVAHELVHAASAPSTPRFFGDDHHDDEEHRAERTGVLARALQAPTVLDGAAASSAMARVAAAAIGSSPRAVGVGVQAPVAGTAATLRRQLTRKARGAASRAGAAEVTPPSVSPTLELPLGTSGLAVTGPRAFAGNVSEVVRRSPAAEGPPATPAAPVGVSPAPAASALLRKFHDARAGGDGTSAPLTEMMGAVAPPIAHPGGQVPEPLAAPRGAQAPTSPTPLDAEVIDEIVERVERRVIEQLERRGARHVPGVI